MRSEKAAGRARVLALCLAAFATPSLALDEIVFINPDMKDRLARGAYQGRDLSYRMRVPDLGAKVYVEDKDISKGITAWVRFLSDELGALHVVSTRIRDDLPKDDSILPRVASRYEGFASTYRSSYSQKYSRARYGNVFEFTLVNARGAGLYPLQIGFQGAAEPPQTFAAHRFFVAGGYLYEFAVLIHTMGLAKGSSAAELNSRAAKILDDALEGFAPANP